MSTATGANSLRCGGRQGSPLRCDERAAKNCGAPLTAASLRLGGSYEELPLPVCKSGKKSIAAGSHKKVCPSFALQAIFRNGASLLYPQFRLKRTNFAGLSSRRAITPNSKETRHA